MKEDKTEKQRTLQQNKALHLFCDQWAKELNDHGLDVKVTLEGAWDVPWSADLVKEMIFKPLLKAALGKDSTTEMNTTDPTLICDIINRRIGEKFGLSVPWPDRHWKLLEDNPDK